MSILSRQLLRDASANPAQRSTRSAFYCDWSLSEELLEGRGNVHCLGVDSGGERLAGILRSIGSWGDFVRACAGDGETLFRGAQFHFFQSSLLIVVPTDSSLPPDAPAGSPSSFRSTTFSRTKRAKYLQSACGSSSNCRNERICPVSARRTVRKQCGLLVRPERNAMRYFLRLRSARLFVFRFHFAK